jgi:hypothetical protein
MKTFEEKWTAWLDDQLTGKELEEFEASLPDKVAAEVEKRDAQRLGLFLKQELGSPSMTNEEFFQHQLREQIEKEAALTAPPQRDREVRASWWSIGRLAWAGAASLAIFAVCTFFVIHDDTVGGPSTYLTQIINARVDPEVSPDATISMFETKEDKVTVLWVDGLQSLPSEYAAK